MDRAEEGGEEIGGERRRKREEEEIGTRGRRGGEGTSRLEGGEGPCGREGEGRRKRRHMREGVGRKERERGRKGGREREGKRKEEKERGRKRERNTETRPQPVPPTTISGSPPQQNRWRPTQTTDGTHNNTSGACKATNTRPKPRNSLNKHNYKEMNSRVLHYL